MILDEFTGRNCKRTEYIDARRPSEARYDGLRKPIL